MTQTNDLAEKAAQGELTPAVYRWLKHLLDNGPSERKGFGSTPYRCARAGLSTWFVQRDYMTCSNDWRETITPAGLAALEAFEQRQKERRA